MSALLGLLEQTAVEASAEAGWDPARYAALGRVWLVRRTRLERLQPVGGGDRLTISTCVADFRRARSLRRYEVRREGGYRTRGAALVARAATDWVYCDAASGRPVSVPEEMRRALFGRADAPTLPRADRVEEPRRPARTEFAVRVRPSHLDHLLHVNNAVWADFLEDAALGLLAGCGSDLSSMLARGGALRLREVDLEYLAGARLDQELWIRSWLEPDEPTPGPAPCLVQTAERADGTALLRARSRWAWRARPAVLGGVPEP